MLKNYIKIAFKTFSRHKLFTAINLLGISLTLYILIVSVSIYENTFGARPPISNVNRVLTCQSVTLYDKSGNARWNNSLLLSPWFINTYIKTLDSAEKVSLGSSKYYHQVFRGDEQIELEIRYTDSEFWEIFDYKLLEGDYYNEYDVEGKSYSAVISLDTSRKLFGENKAIGKYIDINGNKYIVKGIIDDVSELRPGQRGDIWLPVTTASEYDNIPGFIEKYNSSILFYALIMADSENGLPAIREEFQMKLASLDPSLYKIDIYGGKISNIEIELLTNTNELGKLFFRLDQNESSFFYPIIILGIILFMMLPVINLVNINLSRIMERSIEIGIRKTFGASSSVLNSQFIIENIILTLLGGIIALLLTWITIQIINKIGVFEFTTIKINLKIFIYSLLMTLVFGLLSGVLPAVRMSKMNPTECLKGGEK